MITRNLNNVIVKNIPVDDSLWCSSLEPFNFRQDLKVPPKFFMVTSDSPVILHDDDGRDLGRRALPGTFWQCLRIESVPGEPLVNRVRLSNGCQRNGALNLNVSGWVLWDRRRWKRSADRLGLSVGADSKRADRELAIAMVPDSLHLNQEVDAWLTLPLITPIQHYDSEMRNVVQIISSIPVAALSGPTLANCCAVRGRPYGMGERVLAMGRVILDGGWIFYQSKWRHHGQSTEQVPGSGWLPARNRSYRHNLKVEGLGD